MGGGRASARGARRLGSGRQRRGAVVGQGALETDAGPVQRAGDAQEARVVVQRENQAVQFEQHLRGVGAGVQLAGLDGQFKVVWKTPGPVRANPWSPFIPGNDKKKDFPEKGV